MNNLQLYITKLITNDLKDFSCLNSFYINSTIYKTIYPKSKNKNRRKFYPIRWKIYKKNIESSLKYDIYIINDIQCAYYIWSNMIRCSYTYVMNFTWSMICNAKNNMRYGFMNNDTYKQKGKIMRLCTDDVITKYKLNNRRNKY